MTERIYGLHLTMRLAGIANQDALNDTAVITNFLSTLVQRIEMRVLAGPLVGREEGPPSRAGCSGVIILYESHAAIHTYPHLGEAFLDIFSCKMFDIDTVGAILTEFFGTYCVVEKGTLDRGIHWGVNISNEMETWLATR